MSCHSTNRFGMPLRAAAFCVMAIILHAHQPVRASDDPGMPRPSGDARQSLYVAESGPAVIPALKADHAPQSCVLTYSPFDATASCDALPGSAVHTGSGAAFQDKFPRWSSSTFM